jgi:hypothetical protein
LERERNEVLTAQERDEADADLRGTCVILREPSDFIKERILEFYEALDAIPHDQKVSYLRAVETTSTAFVLKESPSPLAFLRCEQFDPIQAARRLVAYWSVRHAIFGDDRAFRCMCPRKKQNTLEEDVYDDDANDDGCGADDNDPNDDDEDYDDDDTGCMSGVDWEALHSGTAKELPHDAYGRAVVVFKANCVPPEQLADRQPVMVR